MKGEPEGVPGMVVSLQTFDSRVGNYHPHIHYLTTDGLFLSNGSFKISEFAKNRLK